MDSVVFYLQSLRRTGKYAIIPKDSRTLRLELFTVPSDLSLFPDHQIGKDVGLVLAI